MRKVIFILFILSFIPLVVLAWDDCPHNQIDCPAPGDCNRYVDIDNDEICDYSQLAPEDRSVVVIQTDQGEISSSIKDKKIQPERVYHFVPISLFLVVLYVTTHILSSRKVISIMSHRKIWNILLLGTFLFSGILGILLVIKINFGLMILSKFNALFWHVETGIAMFAISIFHILWHWAYFKNMLRIRK
ncbi:MAG: hypothetical protein U9Q96_01540 [Patescibacteria group bacterium]|nr:hypothetical protein [Patescibacteria group bacterium]